MKGSVCQPDRSEECRECRVQLQAYLDGDLSRERSLAVFLHVRGCAECRSELDELKRLVIGLSNLPSLEVPAGFDEAVLKAVPYDHYREMAPLRSPRVPVYLEEAFLPAAVRAPVVRASGLVVAGVAALGLLAGWLPVSGGVAVAVGLLPEVLVRLQRLARRTRLALKRTESG